jgi:hypothetical protein
MKRHDDETRRQLHLTALGLFRCECDKWERLEPEHNELVRDNCGACNLRGTVGELVNEAGDLQPNWAGWARAWVQAGKVIPKRYKDAWTADLASENKAYAEALADDVSTFDVHHEGGNCRSCGSCCWPAVEPWTCKSCGTTYQPVTE